jgi:hypothetical protein
MKNKLLTFIIIFICVNILFYLSISFYNLTINPVYWLLESRLFMSGVFICSPLVARLIIMALEGV